MATRFAGHFINHACIALCTSLAQLAFSPRNPWGGLIDNAFDQLAQGIKEKAEATSEAPKAN